MLFKINRYIKKEFENKQFFFVFLLVRKNCGEKGETTKFSL